MPNLACFHAQQCAEKTLTALLIAAGHSPTRALDHETMLEWLAANDAALEARERSDALVLARFRDATRYPDPISGLDPTQAFYPTDAEDALERADRLLEFAVVRLAVGLEHR